MGMFQSLSEGFNSYTAHQVAETVSQQIVSDFISLSDFSFDSGTTTTEKDPAEERRKEEELRKRLEEERRMREQSQSSNSQQAAHAASPEEEIATPVLEQKLDGYTFSNYLADIREESKKKLHRTHDSTEAAPEHALEETSYFEAYRDETEELVEKLIEPLEERLFERALELDYISENASSAESTTLYETIPLQQELINESKLTELGFLLERYEVKTNPTLKRRIEGVYTRIEALLNQSKNNRLNNTLTERMSENALSLAA